MSLSSKSSSSDSTSSGPEDDADLKSIQDADVDAQSEDVESGSEGSIDESSEGEEESANEGAKIDGKKRKRQEAEEESTEEAIVLSHAEKRRQKKREEQKLKAQPAAETRAKKSKKSLGADVSAANSNTKRQNSVWVGNLSYKTTVDDLKAFFGEAGEIARINMPTKVLPGAPRKPENRGFAYVDFTTPEAQTLAIAMSEQHLIGRKLLIKDGDDFAGRPQPGGSNASGGSGAPGTAPKMYSKTAQKILKAQKQPPGPTLFLGNLGFETTVAEILEMLNAHRSLPSAGKKQANDPKQDKDGAKESKAAPAGSQPNSWIRKVRMGTFEDSGTCKGFAFVDFVGTEDATAALTNPKNYSLNGRKLVVEYASPDAVRRGAPKGSASAFKPVGMKRVDKRPRPVRRDDETETVAKRRAHTGVEVQNHDRPPKRQRLDGPVMPTQKPGKRDYKGRSKPGAALASAQRGTVAILSSQGKKIVFD